MFPHPGAVDRVIEVTRRGFETSWWSARAQPTSTMTGCPGRHRYRARAPTPGRGAVAARSGVSAQVGVTGPAELIHDLCKVVRRCPGAPACGVARPAGAVRPRSDLVISPGKVSSLCRPMVGGDQFLAQVVHCVPVRCVVGPTIDPPHLIVAVAETGHRSPRRSGHSWMSDGVVRVLDAEVLHALPQLQVPAP